MPIIPFLSNDDNSHDPLPIRVSRIWQFPLAHVETETGLVYSIQDWIVGLTGASNPRRIWSDLKHSPKAGEQKQLYDATVQLPYTARDGKNYQMEFVNDKGLYLIAQYLRATKSRPVLEEIRRFLAEAGAFVDLVRREPETVVTSGALSPDQAVDAAIRGYRKQGKDDYWIMIRVQGKLKREGFTAALKGAVKFKLTPYHYGRTTNILYKGLWKRSASQLRKQMGLDTKISLRDNQPTIALLYQAIAEDISARQLNEQQQILYETANDIVRENAEFIGKQAGETGKRLGIDVATGEKLLKG